MIHQLKTWPAYYQMIIEDKKTFEVRKNDRNFKEGDYLILMEFDPTTQTYTGREDMFKVGTVLQGELGLPDDICVMSLLFMELTHLRGPNNRSLSRTHDILTRLINPDDDIKECIDGWRGEGFDEMADAAEAQLAALQKVADVARQQRRDVKTPEQLKFNSRLISAVDELDNVVGK